MAFESKISRRGFMVGCSAAIAAMAGSRLTSVALGKTNGPDANSYETVVTVFLRGGWDALNAVLPIGGVARENGKDDYALYKDYRQDLAVSLGGNANGNAIALPGGALNGTNFGLHPGLAPLMDVYNTEKALAIVHACGLANDTRSHFDAMQFIENGTPGIKNTSTGWLTRYLQTSGIASDVIMPALSASNNTAMALMGRQDVVTMNGSGGFDFNGDWYYEEQQRRALATMYAGDNWLHAAGKQTLNAMNIIEGVSGTYTPSPGANYIQYNGFSNQLKTIAQMIKADLGVRAATIDLGGWDTHENQQYGNGDPRGYYMGHLDELSRSLVAFYTDLKYTGHHTRTTLVLMSEFGRRVRENDNRGTDHGHGSVMFVLGGNVNGGKMYGTWNGLGSSALYQREDIPVTTDCRTILSEVLEKRTGNSQIAQVFPGFAYPGGLGIVR